MDFIKNVIGFFKKLFNKEDSVKVIALPILNIQIENKEDFKDSLKMKVVNDCDKKDIETLVCFGDGLGIQTKVSY